MPDEPIDEEYEKLGQINLLEPGKSYEGRSDWKVHSDWRDLHLAVQRAAKVAAADLTDDEEAWFELSHLRILVGNPNVKIYSATLTKSPEGGR
jgi:hypothetical protein